MTEREKITEIIAPFVSAYGEAVAIADALIEAGYGDVKSLVDGNCVLCVKDKGFMRLYPEWDIKELEHRVEVVERALLNLAYKIVIYIGTNTSDFSSIAVGNAKNHIELETAAENVKNVELKQAQKELAEERE